MEHLFSPAPDEGEAPLESNLRPINFGEYIGQTKVVQNIDLMVKSALARHQAMDHVLLAGPPGLGKTSLAMLISKALGSSLHTISGPALEKKGDLAAILNNLEERDVLFIDEIHRLPIAVEEILYSAMEDFRLDIVIGQGAGARTMRIDLRPFTLVGATTRSGLLGSPLRDRFLANLHFDFYCPDELAAIVTNNARKLALPALPEAIKIIAKRSRGTPRIANRILRRVRDFAVVQKIPQVGGPEVDSALKLMDINESGLDRMDRKILSIINDYYDGGPVGIEALCATLGEDRCTIEDVYEPFLLKEGLILRTPRGRQISPKARKEIAPGPKRA